MNGMLKVKILRRSSFLFSFSLLLVTVLIFAQGCGKSKNLGRDFAKNEIAMSLQDIAWDPIGLGQKVEPIELSDITSYLVLECLDKKGLIVADPSVYHSKIISLSIEGEKWAADPDVGTTAKILRGYKIEITGIKSISAQQAHVTANLQYKMTPIGKCLEDSITGENISERIQTITADFEKWDDGWRLTQHLGECYPFLSCKIVNYSFKKGKILEELKNKLRIIMDKINEKHELFSGNFVAAKHGSVVSGTTKFFGYTYKDGFILQFEDGFSANSKTELGICLSSKTTFEDMMNIRDCLWPLSELKDSGGEQEYHYISSITGRESDEEKISNFRSVVLVHGVDTFFKQHLVFAYAVMKKTDAK